MVAPSFAVGVLLVAWALRLRLTLVTLVLVACADSSAERRRLAPLLIANSVVGFVYMWREASRLVEEPQWVGVLQRDVRLHSMASVDAHNFLSHVVAPALLLARQTNDAIPNRPAAWWAVPAVLPLVYFAVPSLRALYPTDEPGDVARYFAGHTVVLGGAAAAMALVGGGGRGLA